MPCSGGIRPAIARSRVDLPEPLRPMTPTASPRLATNEMPRIACTSRTDGRRWRRSIRRKAVAAVPLSRGEPTRGETLCRSSTTTPGSADCSPPAVGHLRPPEEEETDDDREQRPPDAKEPQAGVGDDEVTVIQQRRVWRDVQG